ncbi:MAG: hypothetical protein Q8L48_24960 [Archangium sp.]|nr:hypothetical protein [Archangium sp.]
MTTDSSDPERLKSALPATLNGVLHAFVAFDWGEEIDLGRATTLNASQSVAPVSRPITIAYRPRPLHFALPPLELDLPTGRHQATAEAIVFDFAAVSVALHVPFALTPVELSAVAASLSKPEAVHQVARASLRPLFETLKPAIEGASWGELTEEYFVFEFAPEQLPSDAVLAHASEWMAGLVRLEAEPLSPEEIAEAVRVQLRYGRGDLFVADWAAAVLIDSQCDETLQLIEFANLQLLEFREIDNRLDERLMTAWGVVHALARQRLPLWRPFTAQLRGLGELKVEANTVFERAQNVLKLVGDQYLARVYRLLAGRFHIDVWQENIQRSLDVIEGAYKVLADQAAGWRTELVELTIMLLLLVEIVLSVVRG